MDPDFWEQGLQVSGVELSEKAVAAFFESQHESPRIEREAGGLCYQGRDIRIWVGDFFSLLPDQLGIVDAIYDRAALVALPPVRRAPYARHLVHLCPQADQLLLTFEYNQDRMDGPPFCVGPEEVEMLYADHYRAHSLDHEALPGGLKTLTEAWQRVWWLAPRLSKDRS